MAETFETLITHNKRSSFLLVATMTLVIAVLGGFFTTALSGAPTEDFSVFFFPGAFVGLCLALAAATGAYFFGATILTTMSDSYEAFKPDDPVLFNVVEEMSLAAGLPIPRIFVIQSESPNAFATGRDPENAIIGITTGLRKKLSRDELQAVIAHEMAHIQNYDIRLMMLTAVFAGVIVLLADFFLRSFGHGFRFGGNRRSGKSMRIGSRKNAQAGWIFLVILVGLLLAWLAPWIAKLLQLAVSREREYLADATAVKLCRNPNALADALHKIALDANELETNNRAMEHLYIINPSPKQRLLNAHKDSIWSTHPPAIKRIARLRALG